MFVKLLGEWQTVFCGVLSGSTLFAQACLSNPLGNHPGSAPVGVLHAKIRTYFLKYFWNKHLFYELKHTSITNFAALVTRKISRHSYPLALLILSYNLSIFPFLFVALMACIVMIVKHMPNDGVCPIQVVTQDADMAETANFFSSRYSCPLVQTV